MVWLSRRQGKIPWILHTFVLIYIPQIQVKKAAIDHVQQEFVPSDNPVFQLVPPELSEYAGILFESMGSPNINSENIWEMYCELVYCFEHLNNTVDFIEQFTSISWMTRVMLQMWNHQLGWSFMVDWKILGLMALTTWEG